MNVFSYRTNAFVLTRISCHCVALEVKEMLVDGCQSVAYEVMRFVDKSDERTFQSKTC